MRGTDGTTPGRVSPRFESGGRVRVTPLELVHAISGVTNDEEEVVATALLMLRGGRVLFPEGDDDEPPRP